MWNDLTMQQRADVISMAVKAGMRDMKSIRSFYDETSRSRRFEDGGDIITSAPKLSNIPKFNFDAPDIEKVVPKYEEIKPKEEIPIKPIEQFRTFNKDEDHPILTEAQSYVNSPVFVNRLRRMVASNGAVEQITRIARENVNNTELKNWPTERNTGASYNKAPIYTPVYLRYKDISSYPKIRWGRSPYNNQSFLYQNLSDPVIDSISYGGNNFTPQGISHERIVLAHEIAHSVYKDFENYNEYRNFTPEYRKVLDRGVQKDSFNSSHDNKWTEKIADIWSLQQFAKDNNIWDKSSDTEFTKEMYDKLKSKMYETFPRGKESDYHPNTRSFDMWNDEDLRWLINTTAQNNTPTLDYSNRNYLLANGGHLFADGGIKKYVGALEDIGYDANSMRFYEKATGKELGDSAILDEVIVNGRNRINDYLTEANDNTSVYNVPHREYNLHLKDRAEQGAREAAIWREEHPTMSTWGEAAASIPLAVASVPLIAGGAEALAGTSAGQAASSALLSLSNLAKGPTIAGVPAWAWADAGLTSAFAAHGASEIAEGNITPEALMEVAPLGQLAKPLYKGVLEPGMRLYNSPLTGNWTRIGNREYRFKPGYLGMNGTPIESRKIKDYSAFLDTDAGKNMTPEQWTAAQDAAIVRGDMTEAQRLRDLHFKVSAPKTEVVDINGNPQLVVHKTPNTFTIFDNNRSIGKLNWFATPNAYGKNGVFATGAGKNPRTMKLYVNMRNAHKPTIDEGIEPAYINQGEDGILGIVDKGMTNYFNSSRDAGKGFMMSGGVDNPNALKSADAVTYDDNGIRVPLGERDNFNINDIRYSLLPFGIGLTGLGLVNEE